jgi:hypothetical protein
MYIITHTFVSTHGIEFKYHRIKEKNDGETTVPMTDSVVVVVDLVMPFKIEFSDWSNFSNSKIYTNSTDACIVLEFPRSLSNTTILVTIIECMSSVIYDSHVQTIWKINTDYQPDIIRNSAKKHRRRIKEFREAEYSKLHKLCAECISFLSDEKLLPMDLDFERPIIIDYRKKIVENTN